MFTVKHHTDRGHYVYACHNYMIMPAGTESPVGEPNINPEVLLMDKPFTHPGDAERVESTTGVKLEAHEGSVIYIENAEGHTVDILRPSLLGKAPEDLPDELREKLKSLK